MNILQLKCSKKGNFLAFLLPFPYLCNVILHIYAELAVMKFRHIVCNIISENIV